MSTPRTFTPTAQDQANAQQLLNQLNTIYLKMSENGGSCVPELNVPIGTEGEMRAYAIIAASGYGEFVQTHTGWSFHYRPKDAQPGMAVRPRDPFREALGQRDGFWDTFVKVRGTDG